MARAGARARSDRKGARVPYSDIVNYNTTSDASAFSTFLVAYRANPLSALETMVCRTQAMFWEPERAAGREMPSRFVGCRGPLTQDSFASPGLGLASSLIPIGAFKEARHSRTSSRSLDLVFLLAEILAEPRSTILFRSSFFWSLPRANSCAVGFRGGSLADRYVVERALSPHGHSRSGGLRSAKAAAQGTAKGVPVVF